MKKSKFSEAQISFALKQAETGTKVEEVCRKMGVCEATFYKWNTKLKQLVADLSLDKAMYRMC